MVEKGEFECICICMHETSLGLIVKELEEIKERLEALEAVRGIEVG